METVKKLKEELELNQSLTEVMDVLKGVAAAEFRALAKKRGRFKDFMKAFEEFFDVADFSSVDHPFGKEEGDLGIVMVTSNEGFMGGLNVRVITEALAYPGADEATLVIIGEQGASYLAGLGRKFTGFPGVDSEECYEAALKLRDFIMVEGKKSRFGRLVLFYPRPVTFTVQKVEEIKILPCRELFAEGEKEGDLQQEQPEEEKEGKKSKEFIVESSVSDVIEYLVETWIIQKLFEVFEDSKLAEFSARAVHLEESFQLLLEQGKGVRYQYFRSYHELIDSGMRDIFSAQIARKKAAKKRAEALEAVSKNK